MTFWGTLRSDEDVVVGNVPMKDLEVVPEEALVTWKKGLGIAISRWDIDIPAMASRIARRTWKGDVKKSTDLPYDLIVVRIATRLWHLPAVLAHRKSLVSPRPVS